jgi:mRNA interferase MazF
VNQSDGYLSKLIAVEVTSNIRQIASEVPLGKDEGLPKPCVANCDNIRVVPKASLTKRAGELAPERWGEVKRAVGAALGWRDLTDLD